MIVDKRDKIGRDATAEQLVAAGIPAEHASSILDLLEAPDLDAVTAIVGAENPGVVSLRELLALADAAGIGGTITIDPSVVRGLSYYTGTVWELFDASGDLPRAIAGGGRYDRLIKHSVVSHCRWLVWLRRRGHYRDSFGPWLAARRS